MPDHGAYIPWGEGNRSCPGKKFSQVEHVAVMVAMFREHRVAPLARDGESRDSAKERVVATLEDTGMLLLLQMLHPEKTPLVWQQRAWFDALVQVLKPVTRPEAFYKQGTESEEVQGILKIPSCVLQASQDEYGYCTFLSNL
jgi:hypothetical protein